MKIEHPRASIHWNYCTRAASPVHFLSLIMETLQPKNENKVSLLSIPASDLDASTPNEMLLLQLPPNLSVDDLHSAVFSARPGQPASLVTSHQSSFALQRVETSNAFIMVAPTPSSARVDDRCTKRSKVTDTDKLLTVVPARLLKTGGSGASFLELRKKKLRKVDLWNALKEYVWDPYNSDRNTPTTRIDGKGGRTVADMAIDLQFSEAEILHRLDDVPSALAFPTAETTDTRYMLVAEEPMQECYAAILATLAELAIDYATEPLPENFAAETTDRFTENFDGAEILVGHCLRALQNKKRSSRSALYLDVAKVRICNRNTLKVYFIEKSLILLGSF